MTVINRSTVGQSTMRQSGMQQSNTSRARYFAGAACGALALGLGLAGCGGGDEAGERGAARGDITEGASPIDAPFRLDGADPAELDRFNALMNTREDQTFQIGEAVFDEEIGAVVLTNVSNTEDGRVFTIGRAELYDVNYDYLDALHAAGEDGPPAGEGLTDLFRKVRLYDVTLSGFADMAFNGEITVDAVEFDDLALNATPVAEREPGAPGLTLAGLYLRDAGFDAMAEDSREIAMTIADGRLTGVERGAFDKLFIDGLDYSVVQDREAVLAQIAEAQEGGAAMFDGILGQLFIPERQEMTVETIIWEGADFSGLLDYIDRERMPPASANDLIAIGRMEMANAVTIVNGKQASATASTVMTPIEFDWLIPRSIQAVSTGITADLTAYVPDGDNEMLAAMRETGLDSIESEGALDWTYDREAMTGALAYNIDMADLGAIELGYGLAGLDVETLSSAVETQNPLGLAALALDNFTLRIEDEGLVDAITAVAAAETGQESEALRGALPGYVQLGSAQAATVLPQAEAYAASIAAFLQEGGVLEIMLAPDEPVQFLTLAMTSQVSPTALPEMLGLTVEHSVAE